MNKQVYYMKRDPQKQATFLTASRSPVSEFVTAHTWPYAPVCCGEMEERDMTVRKRKLYDMERDSCHMERDLCHMKRDPCHMKRDLCSMERDPQKKYKETYIHLAICPCVLWRDGRGK